jgi:Domain of unknown function (DUF4157)
VKARVRLAPQAPAPRVRARPAQLPHKALMVSRFGQKAAHVPVFTGTAVSEALRLRQSDAAALDGIIFLPDRDVPSDLVAHELVHALQQGPADLAGMNVETLVSRLAQAPALPAASAAETEARQGADLGPGEAPSQSLPAGIVALRRTGDVGAHDTMAAPPEPARSAAAEPPAPAAERNTNDPAAAPAGGEAATEIAPTFTLPEAPETALDPEVAAQREAEAQAAEQALAAADSPSAAMDAYAMMAPSVKARNMASLGTRIDEANSRSTDQLAAATPPVEVNVAGTEGDMPMPAPIALPGSVSAATQATAAPPPVDVPAGPEQPAIVADPSFGGLIERRFASGAQPEQIDESIDGVSTSNPGVETRVTDRAEVPLEGANDPALMDSDAAARRGEAAAARGEAAQAVVSGPGPEQVVPRAIEHTVPTAELATRPLTPLAAAPETEQLQQLALPDEVVAGFDSATGAQMQASAAATRDQMTAAETQRDTDHQAAVSQAETERATAETQADADQRREIGARREAIQTERQRTVDAQATAVTDVNSEAEAARLENRDLADKQVASDTKAINDTYDQAERDSAEEVAKGERKAEAERERKRKEAEDQSWWERAVGFIKDAFNALVSLVNAIFDAVRSLVTGIIDLARQAVVGLIELASKALQALVSAFGTLLKGLIDNLLGAIFPELAAALTAFIDEAVSAVNSAIAAVATVLVDAVNAIAAKLTAACNAVLDAFQGAINSALALAQALLTGDWAGFLKQILESVLRLLGIDPQAFYALIAQASDAIEIIVNDPLHFVSNLVDAFVGGVQLFADHFLAHLQRGVIGWLTGALGNIQLPTEWSIMAVLDLARQILGLTWDFLRERAAKVIGPENVARLEMAASWIATLVTEGWAGLWQRMQDQLQSLKDSVLDAIKSFILERVVMASITWLASLFNPVGAIVKLVMTIWNLYQFVRNQMQRLMGIAQAVVGMISDIAHDVLDPAKQKVEQVLGDLVPVVIDLLMSLLGVTGVATRVREIITDVRQSIANAADKLIERAVGALGLKGGDAAGGPETPGVAAAGGAGAAAPIGHPVPIDVAEGEDHTLRIDRTGAGGATVMLCTAPRPLGDWLTTFSGLLASEKDATKRKTAEDNIKIVKSKLALLDPVVDRWASSVVPAAGAPAASAPALTDAEKAKATRLEEELAVPLKLIFDNLGSTTADFIKQYQTQLNATHPDARNALTLELRRNAAIYVQKSTWDEICGALKTGYELLRQPLLGSSAAFPTAVRTHAKAQVIAVQAGLTDATDPGGAKRGIYADDVLRELASGVVSGGAGGFGALWNSMALLILGPSGGTFAAYNAQFATAIQDALSEIVKRAGARDPVLVAALGGGIIPFLTAMATTGSSGGIDDARLKTLWTVQANVDLMKDRFRAAMPDSHEWIPSNFIPEVVARAGVARAVNEESGKAAALWIEIQHEWRTPTKNLIFKPEGDRRREFDDMVDQPDGTRISQHFVVLQGHAGAVYAMAEEGSLAKRSVPQTKGQPTWHDALRSRFVSGTAIANSRDAVRSIISSVDTFVTDTILTSDPGASNKTMHTYQNASGVDETVDDVVARAVNAAASLKKDFDKARGIVK